ncbi:hypothetical protein D1B31_11800 [Neobacillus notoginsengisoli]|uniref:Uncharacterized protein n=2 Tax=Neobacillus notoginsengisoli TaxID=1578198 RepID=A0A417YTA6_9BACI|nr:hypothetical protein D1B31_11800 [Neobacillus notoginsengisoli]
MVYVYWSGIVWLDGLGSLGSLDIGAAWLPFFFFNFDRLAKRILFCTTILWRIILVGWQFVQ